MLKFLFISEGPRLDDSIFVFCTALPYLKISRKMVVQNEFTLFENIIYRRVKKGQICQLSLWTTPKRMYWLSNYKSDMSALLGVLTTCVSHPIRGKIDWNLNDIESFFQRSKISIILMNVFFSENDGCGTFSNYSKV